jgi:hypothetical protein
MSDTSKIEYFQPELCKCHISEPFSGETEKSAPVKTIIPKT